MSNWRNEAAYPICWNEGSEIKILECLCSCLSLYGYNGNKPHTLANDYISQEQKAKLRKEIHNQGPPLPFHSAAMCAPPVIQSPVENKVYKVGEKILFHFVVDALFNNYPYKNVKIVLEKKNQESGDNGISIRNHEKTKLHNTAEWQDVTGKYFSSQYSNNFCLRALNRSMGKSEALEYITIKEKGRYRFRAHVFYKNLLPDFSMDQTKEVRGYCNGRLEKNGIYYDLEGKLSNYFEFLVGEPELGEAGRMKASKIAKLTNLPAGLVITDFWAIAVGSDSEFYHLDEVYSFNKNEKGVYVQWTVKNIGHREMTEPTKFRVRCTADGEAHCPWSGEYMDFDVESLLDPVDQSEFKVRFIIPTGGKRAKYRFNVRVNPDKNIFEFNHANNTRLSWYTPSLRYGRSEAVQKIMPKITLTEPTTNFSINTGRLLHIRWENIVAAPERIRLVLKQIGRTDRAISPPSGVINKGHYRWKVPADLDDGMYDISIQTMENRPFDKVKIRVVKLKSSAAAKLVSSAPQSIRITKPKPGSHDKWIGGETRTVKWKSTNIDQNLLIYLKNGGSLTPITSVFGVKDNGFFSFRIADDIKRSCKYSIVIKTLPYVAG